MRITKTRFLYISLLIIKIKNRDGILSKDYMKFQMTIRSGVKIKKTYVALSFPKNNKFTVNCKTVSLK